MGSYGTDPAYVREAGGVKAYIRHEYEGDRSTYRVLLDTAPLGMYYAAVEIVPEKWDGDIFAERKVFAAVALWRMGPNEFWYKPMEELMGPCEDGCPAAILDLLTPTDDQYATEWRARCRAQLAKAAAEYHPRPGDRVRLANPQCFQNGAALTELTFTRLPGRANVFARDGYGRVRFPKLARWAPA